MKRYPRRKKQRWLHILFIALILAAAPAAWYFLLHGAASFGVTLRGVPDPALAGQSASVHVIDIGQGDAVLLEQGGEYALIDTGTPASSDALTFYLDAHGVRTLKYLVLTHFHADHIGGAADLLQNFRVQNVLLPDLDLAPAPTSSTALELLEALDAGVDKGLFQVFVPSVGERFAIGTAQLTVIGAGIPCEEDANSTSLITLFTFDNFTYFSAGDAEADAEAELLSRMSGALHADLYKASHHGSSTSSTATLLAELQPSMAAISCGAGNDYGHPHAEPLERLRSLGTSIWRTDQSGNLLFTAKDGVLTVHPEKRG